MINGPFPGAGQPGEPPFHPGAGRRVRAPRPPCACVPCARVCAVCAGCVCVACVCRVRVCHVCVCRVRVCRVRVRLAVCVPGRVCAWRVQRRGTERGGEETTRLTSHRRADCHCDLAAPGTAPALTESPGAGAGRGRGSPVDPPRSRSPTSLGHPQEVPGGRRGSEWPAPPQGRLLKSQGPPGRGGLGPRHLGREARAGWPSGARSLSGSPRNGRLRVPGPALRRERLRQPPRLAAGLALSPRRSPGPSRTPSASCPPGSSHAAPRGVGP